MTLNNLLAQIFDIDPAAVKSGRANAPISLAAIREIPFEWDSEAITFCLDQMTGRDGLPAPLMAPTYAQERDALQRGRSSTALEEDTKGTVSRETIKRINEAVAKFRAKFMKNTSNFELGYEDALDLFHHHGQPEPALERPQHEEVSGKARITTRGTVGDLVAFMDAYNLRFGPATSDRQIEIYNGSCRS